MIAPTHTPVLVEEAIQALAVGPGGRYIDATLGGGGHAAAILELASPGGQLLGIDADPEAIKVARERLSGYGDSSLLINENFANLEAICLKYDFFPVHGILFDLGLSSLQLGSAGRGFSFQQEGPLDMRFSPRQKVTAADIINTFPEAKLAELLKSYGEEHQSLKIARYIIKERPLKTTLELGRVIERAVGPGRGRIHPATKTFQALRIAVNDELQNLEAGLRQAVNLLGFGGRLVVISYHSLEDRIVKRFTQQESRDCICPPGTPTCVCNHSARLRLVNRRVIIPQLKEIKSNRRARSAKLRAAERLIDREESHRTVEEELFFLTDVAPQGWRKPDRLRQALRVSLLSKASMN